jgi:hypothetical protein
MGMDVYGRNPSAPEGEYFCASIWKWQLLAKLVTALCPYETSSCEHWYSNDGDGLDSVEAIALADALEQKLRSGELAAALCEAKLIGDAEPPIPARLKARIGSRVLHLEREPDVDEHVVDRFAAFVRASGGFSIW